MQTNTNTNTNNVRWSIIISHQLCHAHRFSFSLFFVNFLFDCLWWIKRVGRRRQFLSASYTVRTVRIVSYSIMRLFAFLGCVLAGSKCGIWA